MTARLALLCIALTFSLSADQFASDLQTKYGPPLHRETFRIPAGEMVVDYSTYGDVCTISLPAMAPDKNRPNASSTKAMDEFILELVPESMRGKELRRMVMRSGLGGLAVVEYENVSIAESLTGEMRTAMSVHFKNVTCADGPPPVR